MKDANFLGFPFSYGVFQDYYSTHEPFSSEPSGIAVIGTSAMVKFLLNITQNHLMYE